MKYYEGMRVRVDTSSTGIFTEGLGRMVWLKESQEWVVRFDDYSTYIDKDDSSDFHYIRNTWVVTPLEEKTNEK